MLQLAIAAAAARVVMANKIPNVEPIMAFVILAAQVGAAPALVGFLAMVLSDLVILPGPWTMFTSLSYGIVGLIAGVLKPKRRREVLMAAGALTVLYDLLTNIGFAVMMGSPMLETLIAGIPFSFLHIFSNCAICALLLPGPLTVFDVLKIITPNKKGSRA